MDGISGVGGKMTMEWHLVVVYTTILDTYKYTYIQSHIPIYCFCECRAKFRRYLYILLEMPVKINKRGVGKKSDCKN